MSEEYLDIVDENGNLTGEKELRSVCHAKGLWHRTVHVYLFRRKKGTIELLVHKRAVNKDIDPDRWTLRFGGHIESGKTPIETALSEVREELGLFIEAENLINGKIIKQDNLTDRDFNFVYYLEYSSMINKLFFNDNEVQKVKWMRLDEIETSINKRLVEWGASINIQNWHKIKEDLSFELLR